MYMATMVGDDLHQALTRRTAAGRCRPRSARLASGSPLVSSGPATAARPHSNRSPGCRRCARCTTLRRTVRPDDPQPRPGASRHRRAGVLSSSPGGSPGTDVADIGEVGEQARASMRAAPAARALPPSSGRHGTRPAQAMRCSSVGESAGRSSAPRRPRAAGQPPEPPPGRCRCHSMRSGEGSMPWATGRR